MKKTLRLVAFVMGAAVALSTVAGGEQVNVTTEGRAAFRRGETPAAVRLKVKNVSKDSITGARATVEQLVEESCVRQEKIALGDLAADAETVVPCAVETRVRPGWHALRVTVTGCRDGQPSLKLRLGKLATNN